MARRLSAIPLALAIAALAPLGLRAQTLQNFSASSAAPIVLPSASCDIYATAGTPCIAAHSMARRMFAAYTGNLFELERESDAATLNVGTLSNGLVDTSPIAAFCSGTVCTVEEIYDQANTPSSGNNLPQTTQANQGVLIWNSSQYGSIPEVSLYGYRYFRNRTATVNMPTGASATTEYMVVDAQNKSNAAGGTYGNMENTVVDNGKGTMFALAYATGGAGTYGSGTGPWPGTDWEDGAQLYGLTPTAPFISMFTKYNPSSTTWELASGNAESGALSTLVNGAPPAGYTLNMEGGLSLGEGGDSTITPVNFIEGAILATTSADATDASVQSSITAFYAAMTTPANAPVGCGAGPLASNLLTNSLNLASASWTAQSGATVASATDPNSGSNAGLITGTTGSQSGSIHQTVSTTAGQFYTFSVYVLSTSVATVFPDVDLYTSPTSTKEYFSVFNTNTGFPTPINPFSIADPGPPWSLQWAASGSWMQEKMVFQTLPGSTSTEVFLQPPVMGPYGVRATQSNHTLNATYYCPILQPGIN